jgi:hypothetical protein
MLILALLAPAMTGCGWLFGSDPSTLPGQLSGEAKEEALRIIAQSPTTPVPFPGSEENPVQLTPGSGPRKQSPASAAPEPDPEPAAEETEKGFTIKNVRQVEEGMSFEEISSLLGMPGFAISRTGNEVQIGKWEASGTIFYGKFEDGQLIQKRVYDLKKDGETKAEAGGEKRLDTDQYNTLTHGMTLEDVLRLMEVEANLIGSGEDVKLYKWEDDFGSSFTARFEDNRLVRKTGVHVSPRGKEKEASEEETAAAAPEGETPLPEDAGAKTVTTPEAPPEETGPAPQTPAQSAPRTVPVSAPQPAEPPRETAPSSAEERTQRIAPETDKPPQVTRLAQPERKQVYVVGGRSGEAGEEEESYRERYERPRKADLPDFTYSVRNGNYSVHLVNRSGSRIKAGLRSGKHGVDTRIPAGGDKEVKVNKGRYQLYYIFEDDPYTLHHGETMNIDGMYLADVLVTLYDEGADMGALEYGLGR